MRIDRVNLVAREFIRHVSGIQAKLRPNSTREEIINEYGVENIYKFVKNYFLK